MECSVDQKVFSAAVAAAGSVVDYRSPQSILACLFIETFDGCIKITGTNVLTTITMTVDADIKQVGVVALPAQILISLAQTLRGEDIKIKADGTKVIITSGKSKSQIKSQPHENYPEFEFPLSDLALKLKADHLKRLIKSVIYSAHKPGGHRPVLESVYMGIDGNRLTVAAGDGYRGVFWQETVENTELTVSSVVPANSMSALRRVLQDDEEVSIYFPADRNLIVFKTNTTEVRSQVIEGSYPLLWELLPKSYAASVIFNRDAMLANARRVELFARDMAFSVELTIPNADNPDQLVVGTLKGVSREIGQSSADIEMYVDGKAQKINMSVVYLIQCLNEMPTEDVMLQISPIETKAPLVFRPAGDNAFVYAAMVSPMQSTPANSIEPPVTVDESDPEKHLRSVYG